MMIIFCSIFYILYSIFAWFKPKWALFLICLFLPSYQIRFKIAWLPLTFLEGMILILFMVWIIKKIFNFNKQSKDGNQVIKLTQKIFFQGWQWPILAWLGIATLAMFIAPDFRASAGIWKAYFIEPILLLIIFLDLVKNDVKKNLNFILLALGISALYSAIWAISQKFLGGGVWSLETWKVARVWRATGPFSQPNFLGLYLGPIIILAFGKIILGIQNKELKIKNIFYTLVFCLAIIAIILARSNGAIIGVLASLMFIGLILKSSRKWAIISFIILLLIIGIIPNTRTHFYQRATFQNLSGQLRLNIWQGSFSLLKAYPVLGVGLSGYQKLIHFYQKPYYHPETKELVSVETHPYPHNVFLAIWCEMGLAGLIALFWILIKFFHQGFISFRNKSITGFKKLKFTNLFIMAAMVEIIIHGLVDTPYFKNDLSILFWLIIGLMILENFSVYNKQENCILKK